MFVNPVHSVMRPRVGAVMCRFIPKLFVAVVQRVDVKWGRIWVYTGRDLCNGNFFIIIIIIVRSKERKRNERVERNKAFHHT